MFIRIITPAVLLFALWLLLSGYFKPLLIGLGLGSAGFAAWLATHLDIVRNPMSRPLRFSVRLVGYVPWLIFEVIKSNFDVAWRLWHPRLPISPRVVSVTIEQTSALGIAAYANSITLTPGTVSIGTEEGVIQVHALADEIAEGLLDGEMGRRVRRLEDP